MALKHWDITVLGMALGISILAAATYFIYPNSSDLLARIALCFIGVLLALNIIYRR